MHSYGLPNVLQKWNAWRTHKEIYTLSQISPILQLDVPVKNKHCLVYCLIAALHSLYGYNYTSANIIYNYTNRTGTKF